MVYQTIEKDKETTRSNEQNDTQVNDKGDVN